jgi:hypothetical protein
MCAKMPIVIESVGATSPVCSSLKSPAAESPIFEE